MTTAALAVGPKATPVRLLMTCGDSVYEQLQEMAKSKRLWIPHNVLLVKKSPQLDVLKRASLFITHSGQGSTSESIHYGVPMVCIPFFGDRPSVAYRVCDELGLGKRLDFDKFTAKELNECICKLLRDKSYLERCLLFSKISRKYNAPIDGAKIVFEFVQSQNS